MREDREYTYLTDKETRIKTDLENRRGRKQPDGRQARKEEILPAKKTRPVSAEPTLKIPKLSEEMSEKNRETAINAILFQCQHDPVEVLKRSKEIKELLLAPEINAVNFTSLESKAKCDLRRAANAYEKELKIIEGLGGNGDRLIMPQNKDALVAAKERACEAVIEMMRTEKILEAVKEFKK